MSLTGLPVLQPWIHSYPQFARARILSMRAERHGPSKHTGHAKTSQVASLMPPFMLVSMISEAALPGSRTKPRNLPRHLTLPRHPSTACEAMLSHHQPCKATQNVHLSNNHTAAKKGANSSSSSSNNKSSSRSKEINGIRDPPTTL